MREPGYPPYTFEGDARSGHVPCALHGRSYGAVDDGVLVVDPRTGRVVDILD